MSNAKVSVLSESPCVLGEGPHWDEKSKTLLYVNYHESLTSNTNGKVHRINPYTLERSHVQLDTKVSSVIPRSSNENEFVVTCSQKVKILDWNSGQVSDIAQVGTEKKNSGLNDAKCDASGRLWTGTLVMNDLKSLDFEKDGGSIFSIDGQHKVTNHEAKVTISNGIAFSLDSKVMYHIDSAKRTVDAFDLHLESGQISNRRSVIDFTSKLQHENGIPDGMTIDIEGKLWVAYYDQGKIFRVDPEIGEILQNISFPCKKISSCIFGGDNYEDLFVTSIALGMTEDEVKSQPLAGHVFKVTGLGVKGLKGHTFAG